MPNKTTINTARKPGFPARHATVFGKSIVRRPTSSAAAADNVAERGSQGSAAAADAVVGGNGTVSTVSEVGAAPAPTPACTEIGAGQVQVASIAIAAIGVDASRRPDPDHVQLLAASVQVVGLHTPITVRRRSSEGGCNGFEVVAGCARLAAVRELGHQYIDAFILEGDELAAGLWRTAENLDRRELSSVEAADASTEFDRLLEKRHEQVVQLAPPGGVQPHDQGIRRAALRLGVSREKLRRWRQIAGLSPEAKAEAKSLGLDDNKAALIEASKDPTAEGQIAKLRERAAQHKSSMLPKHKGVAEESPAGCTQQVSGDPETECQPDDNDPQLERQPAEADKAANTLAKMPGIPAVLQRLSKEDEPLIADLVDMFEREILPKLATASTAVRDKVVDEITRRVRALE